MIVLTGGAGFIGSCFLRRLNDAGIRDVLVVDRLGKSPKWRNLVHKQFRDLIDPATFLTKLQQGEYGSSIEVIVHLGARTDTTEQDVQFLVENNFSYSCALLEYAHRMNVRFIYASSAATYGRGEQGFAEEDWSNREPLNAYAFSKYLFDFWVYQHHYFQSSTVGLIFFNVYGPNEYHKGAMASMVFKAFQQLRTAGVVRLFKSYHPAYADGEQKRDFVYVKDVVEVLWRMLKHPEISGLYNVGTGVARSWNDVVRSVATVLGVEPRIEYVDMPEEWREQYQYFTQADLRRLQQTPAMVAFQTLEVGVEDYVRNYLMSRQRYW